MKRTATIILLALVGVALMASLGTTRPRTNKPMGAYLTSARIAVVDGRPTEALMMLDSVSVYWGLVPEALHWSIEVYVDSLESTSGVEAKKVVINKMLAYIDSLHMACDPDNEEVDEDLKEDCDEYIEQADSTRVKYFRQFYAAGRSNLQRIDRLMEDLEKAQDSSRIAFIKQDMSQFLDSIIINMRMSIMIDSSEFSPYVVIGDAYEKQENYEEAVKWMKRGYDKAQDKSHLLLPLAYNYIQMDDYCSAIPYYREHVNGNPEDVDNMFNLAICYSNCGMTNDNPEYLDSAMATYRQIVELQPGNVNALANAGRYFLVEAQEMSDSANYYRREMEDTLAARKFEDRRRHMFDSSRAYFKQAFELVPDNEMLAEQYAFTSALLQDCEAAVQGFEVVAEARPDDAGVWTSLGDCYLKMGQYEKAIEAYEQVARLKPEKVGVWENLQALYKETKQPQKATEAAQKVQELSGQ